MKKKTLSDDLIISRKYISVASYVPSLGESYIGVPSVTEPDDCPTMRQIVEKFVRGIQHTCSIYDEYDDSNPIEFVDYFDLMDQKRALDARIKQFHEPKANIVHDMAQQSASTLTPKEDDQNDEPVAKAK